MYNMQNNTIDKTSYCANDKSKRGKWFKISGYDDAKGCVVEFFYCSNCIFGVKKKLTHCPHCGIEMELGK